MCGICGSVGSGGTQGSLTRAMGAMRHRGPDQSGVWFSERTPPVKFGHTRLSILDLSDHGRQPMVAGAPGAENVVVFNGEVYNFAELRSELERYYKFNSGADTEVLLHGYARWGLEGLVKRIRGMFAFAIWDEALGELHLVRDHCGKKPLFYAERAGTIYFASTIPALMELMPEVPAVSMRGVALFLNQIAIPAPESILEGVKKLPPAHMLTWSRRAALRIRRYWALDYSKKDVADTAEWEARIEQSLTASVRRRLVADVPIGAFLSGGVDSSLIVALMARLSGTPIRTVSIGFTEDRFNELPYAEVVARHYGTIHHPLIVEANAAKVLPSVVFACGEPFGDSSILPTYYVAKEARRDLTVVLTGDGGDEAFGGYETARLAALPTFAKALLSSMGPVLRGHLRKKDASGGTIIRKLRWFLEATGERAGYIDPLGVRSFRSYNNLIAGDLLRPELASLNADQLGASLWAAASGESDVDRLLEVEFLHQLPSLFLAKVDSATMAHSLEARCPFLDVELLELSARMPAKIKVPGCVPKGLLKRLAAKYLPRSVIYRRKQGFSVPVGSWFRGSLGGIAEGTLLSTSAKARGWINPEGVKELLAQHRSGKCDHGQRLWMLLMLELWATMMIDRKLKASDSFE